MKNHRRDRTLIGGNIRLEIVHESNPFFAGEPISLVVRLKHIGSTAQHDVLESKIQETEEAIANLRSSPEVTGSDKTWLMQTLWKSLHQEQSYKEETLQTRLNELKEMKKFHEPVELFSCFVQLLGEFCFDGSILDESTLSLANKRTTLVGVNSKMMRKEIRKSSSDLNPHRFFDTNVDGEMSKTRNVMSTEVIDMDSWTKIPIFLVPQTLLFSELLLHPGEIRLFKFKAEDIPPNLCPTYTMSSNFNIRYLCQVGLTKIESLNQPTQHFNDFPIFIQPYIDENLCQFEIPLSEGLRIADATKVYEVPNTFRHTKTNKPSISSSKSLGSMRRKSSHLLEEGTLLQMNVLKEKFKEISSKWNYDEDPDIPIETILNMQFSESTRKEASVRETLTHFHTGDLKPNSSVECSDTTAYPHFKNFQKEFLVNMNEKFICKVSLSKFAYSISDQLDVCLDFKSEKDPSEYRVIAVTACLETFELLNPKHATDATMSKKKRTGTSLYEAHFTSFDISNKLKIKLVPQCTPTSIFTSPFKTDLFQVKWMITFKFVMLPLSSNDDELIMIKNYSDKKGTLFHAKQHLEGHEFIFHIPLNVLPTEKQLGGW